MTLRIDGVECPLVDRGIQLPCYNAKRLRSVEAWREGEVLTFRIRATTEVERLLGYACDLHRGQEFNDSYHHAELSVDGVTIFAGRVVLLGAEHSLDGDSYEVEVRSGGDEWAESAARTRLNKSSVECSRVMNMLGVRESWEDDGAVRMLPVRRDSYPEPAPTGLYVAHEVLLPQDYFPFISVREVVRSIMQDSGYTLRSDFLDTEFAERLMFSGAYRRLNVEAAYAQMGFKAVRTTSTTAVAGSLGKVDLCNPLIATNAGNIVDTVNPNTEDEDGIPNGEAYAAGGCFRFESGRPVFVPKREINAAFDIHLRYTTDYRIASSSRLKGFNRIYVGDNCYVDVDLQNPYDDMRDEIVPGVQYKLFIFDYDPEMMYSLKGFGDINSAVTSVTFDAESTADVRLYCKSAKETLYRLYLGDWALYEGFVEERGVRTVELTIRTPYRLCTPTSPRRFDDISIEGADEGQQIVILPRCSITPIFGGAAGYGEELSFEDVANHDITQSKLIEALVHMFNLCIYSHRPSHTLYVEPYDDFFSGAEHDWRHRQVGESLIAEECAAESFESTTLGYQPADGAAARITTGQDKELGTWHFASSSYAAKHASDTRINPLFMPTASYAETLSLAPTASMLTVGDRDLIAEDDYIAPRIVLYYGMQPLPKGELWPQGRGDRYPLAAFHMPAMDETLCFDDRDGCKGLHRYFDNELREDTMRQWLTTDIVLHPEEYVALFDPASEGANIRSRFRLRTGGDSSLFRLDEIVAYDPERHVATCRFKRLMVD